MNDVFEGKLDHFRVVREETELSLGAQSHDGPKDRSRQA